MDKHIGNYTSNNRVELVRGGKPYFNRLLQLINNASKSLHLQTYRYANDETGLLVGNALLLAAQRGVKVFLMVDGYASQRLEKKFIQKLVEGGVQFKFFEPVFRSRHFYLGRRLHHKVCVADLTFALVGGINVTNNYNDMQGKPAWLDFALSVEGDVVHSLVVLCQKTWNGFQPLKTIVQESKMPIFSIPQNVQRRVRMRRNDWVRRKQEVSKSYLEMLDCATSEVIILSSYFLPGRTFRKAIRKAGERGVEITVIVASVSDIKIAKLAERYMYEWLLSLGVVILEYNESILHGKLAIRDGQWMTLGSYNINDISTYASVELNLDVDNPDFAAEVRQYLKENVINRSTRISNTYIADRTTWLTRFSQWGSYIIFRLLFYFFTFYFRQEKSN